MNLIESILSESPRNISERVSNINETKLSVKLSNDDIRMVNMNKDTEFGKEVFGIDGEPIQGTTILDAGMYGFVYLDAGNRNLHIVDNYKEKLHTTIPLYNGLGQALRRFL